MRGKELNFVSKCATFIDCSASCKRSGGRPPLSGGFPKLGVPF